jgi:DNA invertase Pin-like site-specific DNA recombinase
LAQLAARTVEGVFRLPTRPQLAAALAAAAKVNGTVVVAMLDRLTRDVHFGSGLMARKVAFRVCDLPNADNFQLHLFLALAEKERELISARIKAALRAAKESGQKLGSPTTLKARSSAFAANLKVIVEPLVHLPSRAIAAALNEQGVRGIKVFMPRRYTNRKRASVLTLGIPSRW